jgi:type IV pilus assembly protein PilB
MGVCTLKSLADSYQAAFDRPLSVSLDSVGSTATKKPITSNAQLANTDDQSPVSQYITHLLFDAHQQGCSDIHFEPYQSRFRIRYRVDGMLREVPNPAQTITARLISRLKIMANLDIAQQRVPQDGRIAIELAEKVNAEYRVSTLPTLWGEKVVLRSTQTQTPLQLTQLGLNVQQVQVLKDALTKPQGMILITGPTGSGKTQTLYAALRFLNQSHRNISTAEDPIEMQLDGVNQLQLHSGVGLDYHHALRAFLRQDPDVIMIGEIRDNDTAMAAIKASQTGHLLLSTLHTNSALETITRLINLGIKPYNLAASLSVIIAQRLLRLLCPECKKPQAINQQIIEQRIHIVADAMTLYQANPNGCPHCHLGYKGRIAIFEFLLVDASIKRELLSTQHLLPGEAVIEQACISTLMSSGLELVAKGLTSYSELKRIVSEY